MKITGNIPSIRLSPELNKALQGDAKPKASSIDFSSMLGEKIGKVDESLKAADQAATDFATGKSKNLHEAILAMEMADTSLRMAVTVRNKVIEAYQEVMRMPL